MRRFFKHLTGQHIEIGLYALLIIVLAFASMGILWYSSGVWIKLWDLVRAVVEPLLYGVMLSYVLNPIVTRVSSALKRFPRYANDGIRRRTVAVTITVCLVALLVLVLLIAFAGMLAQGFSILDWQTIENALSEASNDIMGFIKTVQERLADWGLITEESEATLLSAFTNVKNAASTILFTVIFTIYDLIDGDRLYAYFVRVLHNLFGDQDMDLSQLLIDADKVFSGYFRGQAIDASIVGVLSAVTLSLVGVPYAPVVGLLSGLGNLIPYVGGVVGFASIALVCLAEEAWGKMLAGFAVMAVVMFVDGNIINPRLLSDNVEVHPMLVVAALIAGGVIGGIVGMLVAVPTAAWLKIQLDRWMDANEAKHNEKPSSGLEEQTSE